MTHNQDTGGEEWDAAVEAQRSQKSFSILHFSEVADVAVVDDSDTGISGCSNPLEQYHIHAV